jgi:hypothetical protein
MAEKKDSKGSGKSSSENGNGGEKGGAEVLKKLTPNAIMGEKIVKHVPKKGERATVLYRVFGIANGTKSGETNLGPWTAMTGVFEAVRVNDGARFASAVCFLPGGASDMAIGTLRANKEKDPDSSISFGIEVSVRHMERKDGTDGYEYITRDLIKAQQADLLADIRGKALIGYDG